MPISRLLAIPLLLLACGACGACAGTARLDRHRPDAEIAIDGNASDWEGNLSAVEDAKLSVGVSNDDEYLYLALVSANRDVQRQIAQQGLIVWLSAGADRKKELGIQYPIGRMNEASGPPPREEMMRWRSADEAAQEMLIAAALEAVPATIELRRSQAKAGRRVDLKVLEGIDVAVGFGAHRLVYELRIPLRGNTPATLALDSEPGDKITIGIEVPSPDRPAMSGPPGGKSGGGGRGGGPGGMGGGPGGTAGGGRGGGGMRGAMPEPIDAWIEVELTKVN